VAHLKARSHLMARPAGAYRWRPELDQIVHYRQR